MTKTILILGAGIEQTTAIKLSKEMGLKVIAVDGKPNAPGLKIADVGINTDIKDVDAVIGIGKKYKIDGVMTHAVEIPQKISQLKELDPNFQLPLIVKPDLPLIGKKDVRVVWKLSDLELAVKSAIQSSGNGFAEVEKYIDGVDVSALFLSRYGETKIVSYWDELIGLTDDNFIKGIGVSVPSVIEVSNMSSVVKNAIKTFSQNFSEINALIILSFRIDFSGDPYLIEMHGDLGGDLIADVLFPAAFPDFNFFDMALEVAIGNNILQNSEVIPTCLIYNVTQFADELIQNAMICGDAFSLQEGDLLTNLKRLNFLINKSKICLMKMPRHEEWLKDIRN